MSRLQGQIGRTVTFTASGVTGQIVDAKRLDQDGTEVTEGGTEYAVIETIEGDHSRHCYERGEYKLRRR